MLTSSKGIYTPVFSADLLFIKYLMLSYVSFIIYTKISMILLINYKDICIFHNCMVYIFLIFKFNQGCDSGIPGIPGIINGLFPILFPKKISGKKRFPKFFFYMTFLPFVIFRFFSRFFPKFFYLNLEFYFTFVPFFHY